jgi:hypothetical protein
MYGNWIHTAAVGGRTLFIMVAAAIVATVILAGALAASRPAPHALAMGCNSPSCRLQAWGLDTITVAPSVKYTTTAKV